VAGHVTHHTAGLELEDIDDFLSDGGGGRYHQVGVDQVGLASVAIVTRAPGVSSSMLFSGDQLFRARSHQHDVADRLGDQREQTARFEPVAPITTPRPLVSPPLPS